MIGEGEFGSVFEGRLADADNGDGGGGALRKVALKGRKEEGYGLTRLWELKFMLW